MQLEDIPFGTYVRKSFEVLAVQITEENIADLAPFIGTLEQQANGRLVINVDRHKIRNLDKVYVGYWLTKMDNTLRCYSQNAFAKHFEINSEVWPGTNPHLITSSNPPLVTWNVTTTNEATLMSEELPQSQEIVE